MGKYRSEYKYTRRFGHPNHTYLVVGRHGAVHFHVTQYGSDAHTPYSAGLEIHHRQPPDYMADQPPSHDECWAIKCPCWHDGTTLYAEEQLLPLWIAMREDPEAIFRMLEQEADDRWSRSGSDAA